jgi:hypothetical protein
MLGIGLVLNAVSIGLFCWAIFALAVYALPFFVALSIGTLAFRDGAGAFGALLIGVASGALTLAAGRVVVAFSRSLARRHRNRIRGPCGNRRLSCGVRPIADRCAVVGSAPRLRLFGRRLHQRHGIGAFDCFREDPPVEVGRGAGEYGSPSSSSSDARVMRLRRHHRQSKTAQGTTLNEGRRA